MQLKMKPLEVKPKSVPKVMIVKVLSMELQVKEV